MLSVVLQFNRSDNYLDTTYPTYKNDSTVLWTTALHNFMKVSLQYMNQTVYIEFYESKHAAGKNF